MSVITIIASKCPSTPPSLFSFMLWFTTDTDTNSRCPQPGKQILLKLDTNRPTNTDQHTRTIQIHKTAYKCTIRKWKMVKIEAIQEPDISLSDKEEKKMKAGMYKIDN